MLPVELILLYTVYLGMGPGACKISKPLDAGFILFPFWVGLISVVPVSCARQSAFYTELATAYQLRYPFHQCINFLEVEAMYNARAYNPKSGGPIFAASAHAITKTVFRSGPSRQRD